MIKIIHNKVLVKWKVKWNTFKILYKWSVYDELSATKYALFSIVLVIKVFHLVFQGAAMLSLRYLFARLSGTNNIAVPARLSDTSPQIHIYLYLLRFITNRYGLYYLLLSFYLNKLSFNITSLLSTLYIPNLFNASSPNILTNTSYGLFQFSYFLGVELIWHIISKIFCSV